MRRFPQPLTKLEAMSFDHHEIILLFLLAATLAIGDLAAGQNYSVPIPCSNPSSTPVCNSFLYAQSQNLSLSTIAAIFSANESLSRNISRSSGALDFLLQVPCNCAADGRGSSALLHDTTYRVVAGDTADNINLYVFRDLAWNIPTGLKAGELITVHLPCACLSDGNRDSVVVSYAVEMGDTLLAIAALFSADAAETVRMNSRLAANPDFLIPGWELFVPMGTASRPAKSKKSPALALGITIPVLFLLLLLLLLLFWRIRYRRRRLLMGKEKKTKMTTRPSISSLESQFNKNLEDYKVFDSEGPLIFSLEEVENATAGFDGTRVIGVGGFGSVFYGMVGDQEVAIKKMKSNKSKEFFAELKVELIGCASGDDHLYLVYEYLQNGSLSDHLHDPLLRGHQPLSWIARAQVALDSAKGIEYIHDYTKARYVHRDIKTSNILLDNCLRAKVGDFGLAKLVERSNEDDFIATRLVGTPGYLPPESLLEYQTSTKTDVFAFGVVLAELITGYRALIRDNTETTKMKSLITVMKGVFVEEDPEKALVAIVDGNLKNNYPMEAVFKMAEVAVLCLCDDPSSRPEMSEITVRLSQILVSSIEWEASLGGSDEVFSAVLNGR
ncbi:hypothetical protein HPP92_006091 [Vanilla planifolia]|uniref:Uncharacterized protein n=1 Tax=Vanilla planifolia TaxID=51239 RepID=A0A835VDT6_VANPL|nr:hypothetical protein HPP92_006091 [Vanilla planifolia]